MARLVLELKSRGYRVATVRRSPGKPGFDHPAKRYLREIQTGSEAVATVSPGGITLVKPADREAGLDEAVSLLGEDYDLVLAEGFKPGACPMIEVHRKGDGSLAGKPRLLMAIVTDEALETRARQYSPKDTGALVDLLEKGFIRPQAERISLRVNGTPVDLSLFPGQIIRNTVLAMAACLKGVGEIRHLQLFVKKA
jgi:molybdopterin-guanine dinucleotide biosynthesis protein B